MERDTLLQKYKTVRARSESICRPLAVEDYVIQSMADVSPPKWHLGHTSWFFERLVLQSFEPSYAPHDPRYHFIFNSYYQSLGSRVARDIRGTLSRPTVDEVLRYRLDVDRRMEMLFANLPDPPFNEVAPLIELGLEHEEQHQELLLTDIKHILATNPLRPSYLDSHPPAPPHNPAPDDLDLSKGMVEIGADDSGFAWDNEFPRHRVFVPALALAAQPVTNGDYLAFMSEGGYTNPLLWLSEGWDIVVQREWAAPLYWEQRDGEWWIQTLRGEGVVRPEEPVCHVSYYEADAYARWVGKRLPTEYEWEFAARAFASKEGANLFESGRFHPASSDTNQLFGDVWEWTQSAYLPYPGYRQPAGPLGEYNGKFMVNQMVLRGGSCVTPRDHIRASYRNFFHADKRWQFTGFRLVNLQ